MCASKDMACTEDTFAYILSKVRNQDIIYFFTGLQKNFLTRRSSAAFLLDNFSKVNFHFT